MATEVTVSTYCDACMDDGKRTPGERVTLTVAWATATSRAIPRGLDLCEKHAAGLFGPLESAIGKWGGPADVPPRPSRAGKRPHGTFGCPWCDITYGSGSGLLGHLKRDHGQPSILALQLCPLCAEPLTPRHAVIHDIASLGELVTAAKLAGDPHGVISAARTGSTSG